MKNFNLCNAGNSIYPGGYVPLCRADEMQQEIKMFNTKEMVFPPANITEGNDTYKVEVAIPGAKREDFLIQADENILSIAVVHKELLAQAGTENFKLHEFNYNCFNRHIVLPQNTDTEILSAEYKAGILRLYIPKVQQPAKNLHTTIVVY